MNISQAQATYGLFARATSQWPNNVSTLATIGKGQTSVTLSNIGKVFSRTVTLVSSGSNCSIVPNSNEFSATNGNVAITGTMTPNIAGTLQYVSAGFSGARGWSTNGSNAVSNSGSWTRIVEQGGGGSFAIATFTNGAQQNASWTSSAYDLQEEPFIATFSALATTNATGTPVVSASAGTVYATGLDTKDFEGRLFGSIETLKGICFEVLSGSANVVGEESIISAASLSNGAVLQFFSANGISVTEQETITLTATSNNTSVRITALGE